MSRVLRGKEDSMVKERQITFMKNQNRPYAIQTSLEEGTRVET